MKPYQALFCLLLALGLGGFASSQARCLTLAFRDSASVNDTVIRLGDIASVDIPAIGTADIGALIVGEAAPAGHPRFINTEEIVRLIRRNIPSVTEVRYEQKRISIRSDSETHTLSEYESAIRRYVGETIGADDAQLNIIVGEKDKGFKCLRKPFEVQISGLKPGMTAGNVTLDLVARQGGRTMTVPFSCKISLRTSVIVANRDIRRDEPLSSSNCTFVHKELANFNLGPCLRMEDLNGMRARRTIRQGTLVYRQFIEKIPVVAKGETVTLAFHSGRIRVAMTVMAMEQGQVGEKILVQNLQNHTLVKAFVVGKGAVAPVLKGENL